MLNFHFNVLLSGAVFLKGNWVSLCSSSTSLPPQKALQLRKS